MLRYAEILRINHLKLLLRVQTYVQRANTLSWAFLFIGTHPCLLMRIFYLKGFMQVEDSTDHSWNLVSTTQTWEVQQCNGFCLDISWDGQGNDGVSQGVWLQVQETDSNQTKLYRKYWRAFPGAHRQIVKLGSQGLESETGPIRIQSNSSLSLLWCFQPVRAISSFAEWPFLPLFLTTQRPKGGHPIFIYVLSVLVPKTNWQEQPSPTPNSQGKWLAGKRGQKHVMTDKDSVYGRTTWQRSKSESSGAFSWPLAISGRCTVFCLMSKSRRRTRWPIGSWGSIYPSAFLQKVNLFCCTRGSAHTLPSTLNTFPCTLSSYTFAYLAPPHLSGLTLISPPWRHCSPRPTFITFSGALHPLYVPFMELTQSELNAYNSS